MLLLYIVKIETRLQVSVSTHPKQSHKQNSGHSALPWIYRNER